MNKFISYINEVLESLDMPTITNQPSRKLNSSYKNNKKNIHIEGK